MSKPVITLLIYRERLPPIRISGYHTIDAAEASGKEWRTRTWYAVELDGQVVVKERLRGEK